MPSGPGDPGSPLSPLSPRGPGGPLSPGGPGRPYKAVNVYIRNPNAYLSPADVQKPALSAKKFDLLAWPYLPVII